MRGALADPDPEIRTAALRELERRGTHWCPIVPDLTGVNSSHSVHRLWTEMPTAFDEE